MGNVPIEIDWSEGKSPPRVLSLHGAGPEGMERAAYLMQVLAAEGHSCVRFDHAGWGQYDAPRDRQSLKTRVDEALSVIRDVSMEEPLSLIATSMAGHIALELLAHIKVKTLILFCPALYAADAYDVPFGPSFTHILRRPESYKASNVLDHLRAFQGNLLHIIGSADNIIPEAVTCLYAENSLHLTQRDFYVMEGQPHNLHAVLRRDLQKRNLIIQKILPIL